MSKSHERESVRTRPNYFYAIISVALVLFLLGFFGLIILQAQRLVTAFKEKVILMVELQDNVEFAKVEQLQTFIAEKRFTKPGTVTFTSKKEAAQFMSEDFGEDFLKLDLPNPLYDVITFNVRAAQMNPDSLAQIRDLLQTQELVKDVYYQENLVGDIAGNVKKIGFLALAIGLFFLIVAVTLIHNTIRLALYANRFLIKNMELVGASWEFISRPYLIRSLQHGLVSAAIACGSLTLILLWMRNILPDLKTVQDWGLITLLFGVLSLIGVVISVLSTYYVVKKYLKLRVDDLY
ncbi:MAG: cell division protein FtsX [Saprospiraceae bacterium]|nr:MAG: cell division protein FtsX [Saprospiraceae bacterium]